MEDTESYKFDDLTHEEDREALEIEELTKRHAPNGWHKSVSYKEVLSAIKDGNAINAVVMSFDIRMSTILMREAIDAREFARTMTAFVEQASQALGEGVGMWYDKFTGDGYLGYWLLNKDEEGALLNICPKVLEICHWFTGAYRLIMEPRFRKNSMNYPSRSGLAIGVDSGPVHLVQIAGELTIVGKPVVGAVRMVSAAGPYETLVNMQFGQLLLQQEALLKEKHAKIITRGINTKEYPAGQEVYQLKFEALEQADSNLISTA